MQVLANLDHRQVTEPHRAVDQDGDKEGVAEREGRLLVATSGSVKVIELSVSPGGDLGWGPHT